MYTLIERGCVGFLLNCYFSVFRGPTTCLLFTEIKCVLKIPRLLKIILPELNWMDVFTFFVISLKIALKVISKYWMYIHYTCIDLLNYYFYYLSSKVRFQVVTVIEATGVDKAWLAGHKKTWILKMTLSSTIRFKKKITLIKYFKISKQLST